LGLDNPSIPHAHQVDAAHRVGPIRAPDHPPPDLAAIAARNDAFGPEMYALRGGDLRPERDAVILALMARAIGRRLRVLEDAIVSDQLPQRGGIVTEEDVVEALQDRFSLDALGIVETAAGHGCLRCWFIYVPFRI
jgi:hypothetical protein